MSNANFIIAPSNLSIFSNSLLNDTILYTNSSNLRLGNTVNAVAPLNITSNAVYTSNVNMGINNSNPQAALDVIGNAKISSNLYIPNATSIYVNNIQTPQACYVGTNGATFAGGIIKYQTAILDTTSSYNTGTGLFTAPIAGLYQVSASFYNTTSTNYTTVDIYKNNTVTMYRQFCGYQNSAIDASISGALYLAVGDTVGIRASYLNNQTIQIDPGHALSIYLIH